MPRTVRTAQTIVRTGLEPVYSAVDAANGEYFDNIAQDKFLHVQNGAGAPINVTVVRKNTTLDGVTVPNLIVVVPAGEDRMIGPFPNSLYGQPDPDSGVDPAILVNYSSGTTITAALIARGSIGY